MVYCSACGNHHDDGSFHACGTRTITWGQSTGNTAGITVLSCPTCGAATTAKLDPPAPADHIHCWHIVKIAHIDIRQCCRCKKEKEIGNVLS